MLVHQHHLAPVALSQPGCGRLTGERWTVGPARVSKITVGEMDNNVDPASTMQVVNQLIKNDKNFDLLGIPYLGNRPETMALGAHKARAKAVVAGAGVAVPAGRLLHASDDDRTSETSLPVVVKPAVVGRRRVHGRLERVYRRRRPAAGLSRLSYRHCVNA